MLGAILLSAWGSPVLAEEVKLTVNNPEQAKYEAYPVTSGVPLSEAMGVKGTGELALLDASGKPVPAQFKVLARWGELNDASKPIKWVLCDFQADVAPRGKAAYTLKTGQASPSTQGVRVEEGKDAISVDTGAVSFKVSRKGFRNLEDVSASGGGAPLAGGPDGGLTIIRKGVAYRSALGKGEAVVEENGPMRAVVRVRGTFADTQGKTFTGGDARPQLNQPNGAPVSENMALTYTVRIFAFKNKSFVKVETTLESNGNSIHTYFPVNDVFLDGFTLAMPLRQGDWQARFSDQKGQAGKGSVLQLHRDTDPKDDSRNFYYMETVQGKSAEHPGKYPGLVKASSGNGEVSAFVENFWERFPKALELSDSALVVGLLPDNPAIPDEKTPYLTSYATGRHYFSGSWHMTDTTWYDFSAQAGKLDPAKTAACFAAPLFATCEPRWYAQSGAWSVFAPARFKTQDSTVNKALEMYEAMVTMPVDKSIVGKDLDTLREQRALGRSWFGWENYGDWAHKSGLFSSLGYDWPYIMWLQFIRSGNDKFREKALEMTHHSIDMDQLHGGQTEGIWNWELIGPPALGWHHKTTQNAGFMASHTWNGGYTLGYFLTGDIRYQEAAARSAGAAKRIWAKVIAGGNWAVNQTRCQGWSILLLTNLYRITGDKTLLTEAMRIFTGSLLYTEQLPDMPGSGGKGYITETGSFNGLYKGEAIVTMLTYPLEPLCEFHMEASRAGLDVSTLEKYIIRSLDFLKDKAFVGGETKNGRYAVLSLSYSTSPDNPEKNTGGQVGHNVLVAGPLSYAAANLLKNEPEKAQAYTAFARKIFRDAMFFFEAEKASKNDFLYSLDHPAQVHWPWLPVAPKVLGWVGRGGQFYLSQEYARAGLAGKQHTAGGNK
ncbi:hypothetical protein [Fundidesulfovibrio terrae]|uniref:hypothetical protein n=1 Tax=Fundidesulfovibrio terrae TaxID=2922866 RepID=UPI001FAFAA4A|nr:hypothetical protein [Fundidesulfovibrio terrae]